MERGSIRVIIDIIINKVVQVTLTVSENVSAYPTLSLFLSRSTLIKYSVDNTLQLLLQSSFTNFS